ncbi:hypothetical protein Y694_01597 [Methylibium sp. T29-B]|nr:hypothetical protein Y694_01597 [Methylibium sp. T29-B]
MPSARVGSSPAAPLAAAAAALTAPGAALLVHRFAPALLLLLEGLAWFAGLGHRLRRGIGHHHLRTGQGLRCGHRHRPRDRLGRGRGLWQRELRSGHGLRGRRTPSVGSWDALAVRAALGAARVDVTAAAAIVAVVTARWAGFALGRTWAVGGVTSVLHGTGPFTRHDRRPRLRDHRGPLHIRRSGRWDTAARDRHRRRRFALVTATVLAHRRRTLRRAAWGRGHRRRVVSRAVHRRAPGLLRTLGAARCRQAAQTAGRSPHRQAGQPDLVPRRPDVPAD